MTVADARDMEHVHADEIEKDGRLHVDAGRCTILVTGLRVPPLDGTSAMVEWARRVRVAGLRAFLVRLAEAGDKRGALPASDALGAGTGIQALVEHPPAAEARWWIDRRPRRGEPPDIVVRGALRDLGVIRPDMAHAEHLRAEVIFR